jgi:hypothetical protein
MEQNEVLENVIKSLSNYYKKQKSFNRIFTNEPVMSKAIEVFDSEMLEMIDHVFDLIGITNEESTNIYDEEDWTRRVCKNLLIIAAKNEKYVEPAVELIINWENLSEHTTKVETSTWFNYEELLGEHLTGYKKWYEEQRVKQKK